MKWKSLSRVWLFETPWTIQSKEFYRPEYWSGWPFPSPGDFPNPGIKPRSPVLQADSLLAEPQWKPLRYKIIDKILYIPILSLSVSFLPVSGIWCWVCFLPAGFNSVIYCHVLTYLFFNELKKKTYPISPLVTVSRKFLQMFYPMIF